MINFLFLFLNKSQCANNGALFMSFSINYTIKENLYTTFYYKVHYSLL